MSRPSRLLLLVLLVAASIAGCNDDAEQAGLKKAAAAAGIITKPCAIIITPSFKWMDSLQKNADEGFVETQADAQFYIDGARHFLDSMKVMVLEKESAGTLYFQLPENKLVALDLNRYAWAVFFYDATKAPYEGDFSMIDKEYERFRKNTSTAHAY